MRKNKFSQELLNEEIKRYKQILEYNLPFIEGPTISEEDEDPTDEPNQDEMDKVEKEMGLDDETNIDDSNNDDNGDSQEELPMNDDDPEMNMGDEETIEPQLDNLPEEEPIEPEPATDEVEIDVTSIVKGTEEAKEEANKATRNTEMLLKKFDEIVAKFGEIDNITAKIDSVEKEFIKRNPTPVEKLELRSLNSWPYTQKLTDYWADKEGQYDVMNQEEDEFTLKDSDLNDYSEIDIKKSFNDYDEY